ncbi:LysR family transcriptional regulator [Rhodococcus sp. T2V]|uniref:LysR family transcriptional regulator n=1 Tax=Rhodococcus sp. T2V TaxID=3034164 RepID=UPI0023E0BAA8|nr:LysR family transcriptional regulator [Rhodococcus sp. T2V]MDF3312218.1 LysR family transcriptional regulator [Rhodococcus sp. T2V]
MRHLRYFVAVAEAGSIAAASEYLGLAASPLSRRIRDLETHMGGALFIRQPRGLQLSPLGKRLLPTARRVIAEFEAVERLRARSPTRRLVRVGLVPGIPARLSSAIYAALELSQPDCDVDFRPGTSPTQYDLVRRGFLDLATVRRFESDERLSSLHLLNEEHIPLGPIDSQRALAHSSSRPPLAGWTFVCSHDPDFSEELMRFLQSQEVNDVKIVPGADVHAVAAMVQAPQMFTMGRPGDVVEGLVPLKNSENVRVSTRLVWRKDRTDLIDVVLAIEAAITANPPSYLPDPYGPARSPN